MGDPVVWGYKAVKPFVAEHPVGSGTEVRYEAGDEVPAGEWGRAEAFMAEAGTIMRYVINVAEVPGQIVAPAPSVQQQDAPVPVPTEAPAEPEPASAADTEPEPGETVSDDDESFPKAEGGGWYLLSNGEKAHGKAAAIAAQAELDVAAETGGEGTA